MNVEALEASILSYKQWESMWVLKRNGLYENIEFEAFWLGDVYYFAQGMEHSILWYDPELDSSYDYSHEVPAGAIRPVIIISKDSIQ